MRQKNAIIAGMDEAGRGSWAGPVVAAAVILKNGTKLPGLTDSKLLNAEQRDFLYEKIIKTCDYGVGIISHEEIDKCGLLHATFRAFEQALNSLKSHVDHILIDGRDHFTFKIEHTSIIKGDLKIRAISAASIVAKVTRDRLMIEYAQKYPEYSFEDHKGYGTTRHQNALKKFGVSEIHRKSYAPIIAISCEQKTFF